MLCCADDAGATEVAIMLDEESYGTDSILGDTVQPCIARPAIADYEAGRRLYTRALSL